MARGLSDLQKLILILAAQKRREQQLLPPEKRSSVDVRYAEVLVAYFGFPVSRCRWHDDMTDVEAARSQCGGQKFSKEKIGKKRYTAAQAAISRAFARLEKRGLMTCVSGMFSRWSGGELTAAGIEATTEKPNSFDA